MLVSGLLLAGMARADTVLVLGDSLSAAHGIDRDAGWVHLLQQRLGDEHRVVNASISGDTTSGGLERLPDALEKFNPDVVLLELGGNDGLRGLPPEQMKNNLARMIEMSQDAGARVALLGIMIPPNYGESYANAIRDVYPQLAKQYDIPYVPFILEGVALHDDLMQRDQIHPNAKGQPIMLDNIWPVVTDVLNDNA
ncbi:arylesterase [Phytohalomonas tamaricis]|uniref:arylesterase n=1 Tax=Phytohalomonas tamaricis TaxID=2081032 RepID=UPI0021D45E1E|nr:arylesterase [Phytohalomonas tamaricis]